MTKSCGDSVTETHLTFQLEEGGLTPTSPLQFTFEVISAKAACDLNAKWHSRFPEIHWSNVVRNKHYVCYAAKFDGAYFAVSIWSSPIARKLDATSTFFTSSASVTLDAIALLKAFTNPSLLPAIAAVTASNEYPSLLIIFSNYYLVICALNTELISFAWACATC
jgi:hypothetical protein